MNKDLQQLYNDNKKHLSKEAKKEIKELARVIKYYDKRLDSVNKMIDHYERRKLSKEVEMIFIIFTNDYENSL